MHLCLSYLKTGVDNCCSLLLSGQRDRNSNFIVVPHNKTKVKNIIIMMMIRIRKINKKITRKETGSNTSHLSYHKRNEKEEISSRILYGFYYDVRSNVRP